MCDKWLFLAKAQIIMHIHIAEIHGGNEMLLSFSTGVDYLPYAPATLLRTHPFTMVLVRGSLGPKPKNLSSKIDPN